MQKTLAFLIFFLTLALHFFGQDTAILKRTPYKLSLPVDKNSVYEEDLKATPYVMPDKTIQIYPGETIYVELRQDSGKIVSMTAVKEIKDPAITLTIKLIQRVKKNTHELTMLEVHNPFSYRLNYKAVMFLMRQRKWVETNVYPVEPNLSGFETWPEVIISLGLGDWALSSH